MIGPVYVLIFETHARTNPGHAFVTQFKEEHIKALHLMIQLYNQYSSEHRTNKITI